MSFPTVSLNQNEEFTAAELAEIPAEEMQGWIEELLFDKEQDLDRSEILAMLDYDYIAEMPRCRDEDEMEYRLDDLAYEVRMDCIWELVSEEAGVWTFELRPA